MSHFLAISGSRTKFAKPAFLLRFVASLLEAESIDLNVLHATDLAGAATGDRDLENLHASVRTAAGIILMTPVNKDLAPDLLKSVLSQLRDGELTDKAVSLYATGGFVRDAIAAEEALRPELRRLGAVHLASFIHLDSRSWIILGDRRPQLSRKAIRQLTQSLDDQLAAASRYSMTPLISG